MRIGLGGGGEQSTEVVHLLPELKEFLARLLPYALGGATEKVFERNKKPLEAKVFACYLYLHGPSFEQTAGLLRDLGSKWRSRRSGIGSSGLGLKLENPLSEKDKGGFSL
jgi:hypothetical protein